MIMTLGCLVLHGLTGTPATVASLQEALLAADFRVAAPCLAGHGGSVDDLDRSTCDEWYRSVRTAFETLRRETDRVFCAGISLGALLSLKLALDEGWGVRALALLATPMRLGFFARIATGLVRHTPLHALVRTVSKNYDQSVSTPEGRELYRQFSLPRIPAHAVFEISDLQREIAANLGRITNPLLLLHAAHDRVAPRSNVAIVERGVASDIVETEIFPRSKHVLTMDVEQTLVAERVVDFFKRFA